MRHIIFVFLIGILPSCTHNTTSDLNGTDDKSVNRSPHSTNPANAQNSCSVPNDISTYFAGILDTSIYMYNEWISPCYLEVDFDGDGKNEFLIPIIRKSDQKKGFAVQKPGAMISILGAGNNYGTGGDDFKWVDHWSLYDEKYALKTQHSSEKEITGTEEIPLEGEALVLAVEEGATVYLAWLEKEFEWILLDG